MRLRYINIQDQHGQKRNENVKILTRLGVGGGADKKEKEIQTEREGEEMLKYVIN
jgi:hypothetical protein